MRALRTHCVKSCCYSLCMGRPQAESAVCLAQPLWKLYTTWLGLPGLFAPSHAELQLEYSRDLHSKTHTYSQASLYSVWRNRMSNAASGGVSPLSNLCHAEGPEAWGAELSFTSTSVAVSTGCAQRNYSSGKAAQGKETQLSAERLKTTGGRRRQCCPLLMVRSNRNGTENFILCSNNWPPASVKSGILRIKA